jgi:hypothetical protein
MQDRSPQMMQDRSTQMMQERSPQMIFMENYTTDAWRQHTTSDLSMMQERSPKQMCHKPILKNHDDNSAFRPVILWRGAGCRLMSEEYQREIARKNERSRMVDLEPGR